MATITKRQRQCLEDILSNLKKVNEFLIKETTIVGTKTNLTGGKESTYINEFDNSKINAINKHIGSDLCYLGNGIDKLFNFLYLLND
jgi:hypothetical protein